MGRFPDDLHFRMQFDARLRFHDVNNVMNQGLDIGRAGTVLGQDEIRVLL
jgi:hypothetical protein